MAGDFIEDEEILYRCVFARNSDGGNANTYRIGNDGVLRLSSQAFNDRKNQPSVDRAKLRGHQPSKTQKSSDDGVVSLQCGEVRLIDDVSNGLKEGTYKIDVVYAPEENNDAHSQIESSPEYGNSKAFRKVRERLALLAEQRGWEILPKDCR